MLDHQRCGLVDSIVSGGLALRSLRRFDHPNPFALLLRLVGAAPCDSLRLIEVCVPDCAVADGSLLPPVYARLVHVFNALGPYLAKLQHEHEIILDISDHGSAHGISMDRPVGTDFPLIPDLYALEEGLLPFVPRSRDEFAADFLSRAAKLFWRGSTTGKWIGSLEALELNSRVRFCRFCLEHLPGMSDCRISGLTQIEEHLRGPATERLRTLGIMGEHVPETYFTRWRFFPDLNGNTSSWGSIRKFANGMVVIRPAGNRETCFARELIPWQDHAPLAAGIEDLPVALARLTGDNELSVDMAWNGYQAARAFLSAIPRTLERVFDSAAAQALIPEGQAWEGPDLPL